MNILIIYNSDDDEYKIVYSLLTNQLVASITGRVKSKSDREPLMFPSY